MEGFNLAVFLPLASSNKVTKRRALVNDENLHLYHSGFLLLPLMTIRCNIERVVTTKRLEAINVEVLEEANNEV